MSFIKHANLPDFPVKTAIIGKTDQKILEFVESFGISVLNTAKNIYIDSAISCHADINTLYLGYGKILLDRSQAALADPLKKHGIKVIFAENHVSGSYPNDCRLNFALLSGKIIGRIDVADEIIKNMDYFKINVRQGYAKCSTCIVNGNAVITDDFSIKKACVENGIDVLLIGKGDIELPGHEYGFIGGASALIDKNHIIFFGDITKHRDFCKIDVFLNKHGCKYSFLKNHVLTDIGGMVAFEERINTVY